MYRKTPVPIPKSPLISMSKQKSGTYVNYEIDRVYNPEKKFNVPVRRSIGKVCGDDPAKMFPNERYFQFFESVPADWENLPEATRSCCIKLGTYLVIDRIVQECRLEGLLKRHFGSRAGLVLDLAAYCLAKEGGGGRYYFDYAFCHPLFAEGMRIYNDSTVSELLASEITGGQIQDFLEDWNEKRDRRHRIYVDCNAASKSREADGIEPPGCPEDPESGESSPFNASVAYDLEDGVPLFYEEHLGALGSRSQFKFFIGLAQGYGYRSTGFILERGSFSRESLESLDELGSAFLMRVEGDNALVSERVLAHAGTFETDLSCDCGEDVFGTTDAARLFGGEKPRFIHYYFDPEKLADGRQQVQMKILGMRGWLDQWVGRPAEIPEICSRYFTGHFAEEETRTGKQKVLARVEEKDDVIGRELKLCGYFCLITSEPMSAKEALALCRARDAAGQLFRIDRLFLGTESEWENSLSERAGRLFVEFIALIIRSRLCNLLKGRAKKPRERPDDMTVSEAICELEKLELARTGQKTYKLECVLTKKQKALLSAFGITPEDVASKAAEVAKRLATAKDPEPQRDEDEDEEAEGVDFDFSDFED